MEKKAPIDVGNDCNHTDRMKYTIFSTIERHPPTIL